MTTPERGKDWWTIAGTAAALAWLERLEHSRGYPALVAALEDAIRSGMAEGEADALALAADRQGRPGFGVERAFRSAYGRLAGDRKIARQARTAAARMTAGAAADIGRALAASAGDDGSEQDMTDAVEGTTSGGSSRSVGLGVDWWLWGAILAGAAGLYGRAQAAEATQPQAPGSAPTAESPARGPAPQPAQGARILLDWRTAGDSRVCPICAGYEDNSPYTPGNVPEYPHPRCRCSVDLSPDSDSSSFLNALLDAFAN